MDNYQSTSLGDVYVTDNTTKTTQLSNMATGWSNDWQFYDATKNQQGIGGTFAVASNTPKKEKKMSIDKNKRGLFQVILIDPKEKKMLLDKIVIADNIEDVLLEVDAGKVIKDANLQVSEVDKIVNIIGQVRKTRKNKNGEVEIINEDIKE